MSGPDLWQMMRDPQTEEFYDRVVTADACLTLSKGLVRFARHVGLAKRKDWGFGVGADADGFMALATLIERAMYAGEIRIPKACRRTPARFAAYALHRLARDPKVSKSD